MPYLVFSHIGLRFHLPVLVLAIVLVAVAVFAYRRTTPGISPALRKTLTTMRALAFLLIAFVLLDPRSTSTVERQERAKVVALVDRSASMSLEADDRPGAGSRLDRARALLGELAGAVRAGGGEFETLYFASDLIVADPDTVRALGQGTDIAGAVTGAAARYEGEPLAALVLISDGVDTGERLVRPGLPDVPVFAVGVGDTTLPDDVRIEDVDYSSVVRAPSRTTVRATIEYTGERARRATIRLREGARVVFRSDTLLTPSNRRVEQEIPLQFRRPGKRSFTLSVGVSGGDAQSANDRREIVIEAEKASTRVVVVDMTPGWELSFLSDHLRRDETFDFDVVTSPAPGGARGGRVIAPLAFERTLADCDAVILISVGERGPKWASD